VAPITATGEFAIRRLRLNRPALVAKRLASREKRGELVWLERYRSLALALEQLVQQQAELIEEQRALLAEQRDLLRLIARLSSERH
jgi:hypothetical protein